MTERPGEIDTPLITVFGVFGQRLGEHRVEVRQGRQAIADRRGRCAQVLADHDGGVGMLERRRTGEQVKRRRCQRVLVGPPVEVLAHQLFGRGVGHGAHRHIGRGQPAGFAHPAGDPEVGQHDSTVRRVGLGDQDVGGLDVAVQQPVFVGVVERLGHRGDDRGDLGAGHPVGIPLAQQPHGVHTVDIVHVDPQLTVGFAPVVHRDDMRVPQ
ncbi:hypothetical protein LAUMK191_02674 [Mycobacterium attenuatum]|nr:hypothetical protein LAUMK191_02674 [Mycobacterium attenuatum]